MPGQKKRRASDLNAEVSISMLTGGNTLLLVSDVTIDNLV